jgi:hypothetical protein
MIARQMGDTRYRGKIVWMLLTSRPDMLPIDLKRQGRAEVHIPLFYPHDQAEMDAMFTAMARKCGVKLAPGLPGPVDLELGLSGADIESVVLAARRKGLERAADAGNPPPTRSRPTISGGARRLHAERSGPREGDAGDRGRARVHGEAIPPRTLEGAGQRSRAAGHTCRSGSPRSARLWSGSCPAVSFPASTPPISFPRCHPRHLRSPRCRSKPPRRPPGSMPRAIPRCSPSMPASSIPFSTSSPMAGRFQGTRGAGEAGGEPDEGGGAAPLPRGP